ncbi:hypothetical protein BD413DRAFT_494995 [Trametes elegans]|nr:hypothetical protein BD413DRAFT_494995 [Trametes elegans]
MATRRRSNRRKEAADTWFKGSLSGIRKIKARFCPAHRTLLTSMSNSAFMSAAVCQTRATGEVRTCAFLGRAENLNVRFRGLCSIYNGREKGIKCKKAVVESGEQSVNAGRTWAHCPLEPAFGKYGKRGEWMEGCVAQILARLYRPRRSWASRGGWTRTTASCGRRSPVLSFLSPTLSVLFPYRATFSPASISTWTFSLIDLQFSRHPPCAAPRVTASQLRISGSMASVISNPGMVFKKNQSGPRVLRLESARIQGADQYIPDYIDSADEMYAPKRGKNQPRREESCGDTEDTAALSTSPPTDKETTSSAGTSKSRASISEVKHKEKEPFAGLQLRIPVGLALSHRVRGIGGVRRMPTRWRALPVLLAQKVGRRRGTQGAAVGVDATKVQLEKRTAPVNKRYGILGYVEDIGSTPAVANKHTKAHYERAAELLAGGGTMVFVEGETVKRTTWEWKGLTVCSGGGTEESSSGEGVEAGDAPATSASVARFSGRYPCWYQETAPSHMCLKTCSGVHEMQRHCQDKHHVWFLECRKCQKTFKPCEDVRRHELGCRHGRRT